MTNISLRTFQQKVESLIEENNIDQAIADCYLIFKLFPKNLRTFQILSKAFLQNQNFIAAEKVFDIILQIEPDDFISHIGKSIIAERNSDLDLAIEHMKFAFENQPTNEGLQVELKRLYLLKDGVEPNKILLTRGALIKMYLKGNLFEQVISESRIGLSESPLRIDYKVAKAKAYFKKGDLIQAVETSIEIVSQLPFCWAANEILNNVITKNHTLDSNDVYFKRLVELDPYFEFMLSSTNSILDIPDIAVLIDDDKSISGNDFNFESFIEKNWGTSDFSTPDEITARNIVDWDSIISKAIDTPIADHITDENEQAENISNNSNDDSGEQMANSRKNLFLEKLKGSKTQIKELRDLPEWFFDDQGEVTQKPQSLEKSDLLNENSMQTDDMNILPVEFSSNPGEEGFFDTEIQPEIDEHDNFEQSNNIWINDDNEQIIDDDKVNSPKMADTQPIKIDSERPDEILIDSAKAFQGGNFQFAISNLRKLVSENRNLAAIADQLENAIESNPEKPDLYLLLGEVYTRLDEKEKALALFQKAQKLISL